jgi:hypothetical protein
VFEAGRHAALSQHDSGPELKVEDADENELYAAMDWLVDRQLLIEQRLAARHLHEGAQVFYEISSSYYEGFQ